MGLEDDLGLRPGAGGIVGRSAPRLRGPPHDLTADPFFHRLTRVEVDPFRWQFPNLLDPPSDDICYATQNRQQAVKEIAKGADLVLVVGSGNSSNSVRLVEVALENGAKASYRVDDASEIDEAWLNGVESVGVTSGASVPEDLVEGVLDYLADRGYPAARAVHTAEESRSSRSRRSCGAICERRSRPSPLVEPAG